MVIFRTMWYTVQQTFCDAVAEEINDVFMRLQFFHQFELIKEVIIFTVKDTI